MELTTNVNSTDTTDKDCIAAELLEAALLSCQMVVPVHLQFNAYPAYAMAVFAV